MPVRLQLIRRGTYPGSVPRTRFQRFREFLLGLLITALAAAILLAAFLLGSVLLAIAGIILAVALLFTFIWLSLAGRTRHTQ